MQVADTAVSVCAWHDVCYVFHAIFHLYVSLITHRHWDIH